jgi:fructose-1,6-bisphosphatase/inositol monophosphatase family enzyme
MSIEDAREELSADMIKRIRDSVIHLVDAATKLVKEKVGQSFSRELKKDHSFVTEVDFAVEDLIRDYVSKVYPEHGIVGEEREDVNPSADFQWITDPVDGTQNLVHGVPTYGVVIGVHYKGKPLAGAISHPLLDLTYAGAFGLGTFCGDRQVVIYDSELINQASIDPQEIIALSTRACFQRSREESFFDQIMKEHPSTRVYYDIFSTTRAIEGQIGAVIEFGMKIWDIAATEILVTEAGGAFEVLRKVEKQGIPTLISIVAGKPSIVSVLKNRLGGYQEFEL